MNELLYYRQVARKYYAIAGNYIDMAAKFLLTLAALLTVNRHFGSVGLMARTPFVLAVSLFCSVLPWGYVPFTAAVWTLIQLVFFSWEAALIFAVLLLVLAVVKYLMLPGCGAVMALLPLLLTWKIPYALPVVVGLCGEMGSFSAVGSGVLVYYLLQVFYRAGDFLKDPKAATIVEKLLYLVKQIAACREMYFVLGAFCVTTVAVYLISHLTLKYTQYIGIGAGALLDFFILWFARSRFGLSFGAGELIGGFFLALAAAGLYQFFTLALAYKRTEKMQFEDDDFVYYVKAVPKVVVPERKKVGTDTILFKEADIALMKTVEKDEDGTEEETGSEAEEGPAEETEEP